MRRKLQRRQRSRRLSRRRQTRRLRGGSLPVPPGALVGVRTEGEYGVPILIEKEKYEDIQEKGGL